MRRFIGPRAIPLWHHPSRGPCRPKGHDATVRNRTQGGLDASHVPTQRGPSAEGGVVGVPKKRAAAGVRAAQSGEALHERQITV